MDNPPPKQPHWTAGAVALIIIGLVIAGLSGLCSAALGAPTLIFSGPFIILGIALIVTGWRESRRG
jgi:hypothetical protein